MNKISAATTTTTLSWRPTPQVRRFSKSKSLREHWKFELVESKLVVRLREEAVGSVVGGCFVPGVLGSLAVFMIWDVGCVHDES
ncbi:hypothetical protein Droror1_Dr00014761 [Drosera rotundifolia]